MHPVEDIELSPWPVDVVEFGADAYTHRKQVGVKQLYNQVPQTAWVSSVPVAIVVSWEQDAHVRISLQTEVLWPSVTHGWTAQPGHERSAAMVRKTLGQYVTVCPRLQLTSHAQPTSTLSRIKCERYIFYKEVCSFVHWSRHYCRPCFRLYLYIYCIVVYNKLILVKFDKFLMLPFLPRTPWCIHELS